MKWEGILQALGNRYTQRQDDKFRRLNMVIQSPWFEKK